MNMRHITESDRETLKAWIEADPDHRGRVIPDFFIPPDPEKNPEAAARWAEQVTSCLFEDHAGPVLFARFTCAMRVDIQFNPAERVRTAIMLPQGFSWLLSQARQAHFSQVIFDSQDARLITFCDKKFGFKSSPNEYLVRVD
jgi:hypothetical protein